MAEINSLQKTKKRLYEVLLNSSKLLAEGG
jgi:hypothetical protein